MVKYGAVLGNGPSRKSFDATKQYDYKIGCNFPWTDVDSTVILDTNVVVLWSKDYSLIKTPAYFTSKAWMLTDEVKMRPYILENNLFLGFVDKQENDSSGNVACKKLIEMGYNYIDIYGMDAWFTKEHGYNVESYTRKYFPEKDGINNSYKWKQSWMDMIQKNPTVKLNFIA
jgi:hypothetical protein